MMEDRHPCFGKNIGINISVPPFCGKFACYGILVGPPMHLTCDEIYHRITWRHSYLLKKMDTNFRSSLHKIGFPVFSHAMEY